MDQYQKLTDVEILETLGSLKKELMAELCKLPEWSENETVHLNENENISPESREIKCDGEVISSPKIQIVEHSISQSPKPSMFLKSEDAINMKSSTCNYHISEVDDICGKGFNNVVPGILPESKPDATVSGDIGEHSVVSKEVENPIICEEYKSDIKNEYKTSFMKRQDVKKKEVVKHDDGEVPNIKTEERIIMNLTDIDLKNPVKNEDHDTRNKYIHFIIPNANGNCSIPSNTICTNEMYIGDLKLHKARCSASKGKIVETKVRLTRHIQNHNEYISLQKNEPNKTFIQETKLNKEYSHDEIRPYECPECNKRFTQSGMLKIHLRIHDGICAFESHQCKKRFSTSGDLKTHLKYHDEIRPYECPHCKKRFTENVGLKTHLRIHDGIRPYEECPRCKKRFTTSGYLETHLRIHDGIRPQKCRQHKNRSTSKGALKTHLRIHDGNRPYEECPRCKKRFTTIGYLETHLRIHDGIRPYEECPQCKKRFTTSGYLETHLRIHDGIRPYKCHQCKKSFTQSRRLKIHLRIHDAIP